MPTMNEPRLTTDQRRLINMYVEQYNQTREHIDTLLDMLDEIRGNINDIINRAPLRRTRMNRHNINSNVNVNRFFNRLFNDTQNYNVFYDYNNPINPSVYDTNIRNEFYDMSFNRTNANRNNYSTLNDYTRILETFLNSSVVVRPTHEQIEDASRLIRYGDIENPLNNSCPISLDEFNIDDEVRQLLPCGHIFHPSQFQEWFSQHVRCPVCRYDIRNYRSFSRRDTPNTTTQNEQSSVNNNTSSRITSTNLDTNNSTESSQLLNMSREPITVSRNPITNQVEDIRFDINDTNFTNNFIDNFIDNFARNIFQTILNPNTHTNDRIMIDPSNNIIFYETIITPEQNNNQNNN